MNIVILADDLTGANDTGVQFLKTDLPVHVFLDSENRGQNDDQKGVQIINTESRSMSPDKAYLKLSQVISTLNLKEVDYFYKKIDSTLRGNVGQEIDAILDTGTFDVAIVAPAYPENKRIVIGGYHLVDNCLLEDTEIANDPKTPVLNSFLPELIASQSKYPVRHLATKAIRSEELSNQIDLLVEDGSRILTMDSSQNKDLELISEALHQSNKTCLWVGSAALAQALANHLAKSAHEPSLQKTDSLSPVLTIAGSVSQVTRHQVNYLAEQGLPVIALNPIDLVHEHFIEEKAPAILHRFLPLLESGQDLVITTEVTDTHKQALDQWLEEHHLPVPEVGNRIAASLGYLGSKLVEKVRLSGLVLTGGDIAFQTCRSLKLSGLTIVKEIEEGIPLCQVKEGAYKDLKVITKAGAFGKKTSLFHAVQSMKQSFLMNKQMNEV